MFPFESEFQYKIYKQKYSRDGEEEWTDTVDRVVTAVGYSYIRKYMEERVFIPGGRYLYACGRPVHNVSNCFALRATDSREGWAKLMYDSMMTLMMGGGIGVDYSALRPAGTAIVGTGGVASGPISLMKALDAAALNIRQGGSRRSALFAGLDWQHKDIYDFIKAKHRTQVEKDLKVKDFNQYLPLELTNLSINLDRLFFMELERGSEEAKKVWKTALFSAFETGDPGFSVNYLNPVESLRNACVLGNTELLTKEGYKSIESLVDSEVEIWNGFEWSKVTPKITGYNQPMKQITFSDGRILTCTCYHKFHLSRGYHGETQVVPASDLEVGDKLIKHSFPIITDGVDYENSYIQGFKSADGMDNYDHTLLYEPKWCCLERLGGKWGTCNRDNVVFVKFPKGLKDKKFVPIDGNMHSKLEWLAGLLDGDGCELKEGGMQLCSVDRDFLKNLQNLLSTLGVQSKIGVMHEPRMRSMPDGKGGSKLYPCQKCYRIMVGAVQMQELKRLGFHCERLSFNKTPQRDASQFVKIVSIEDAPPAATVYCFNEPKRHLGVFNGVLTGQCSEFISEDSGDSCNLGTIFINRIRDKDHMAEVVRHAMKFLIRGALYTNRPTEDARRVARENNKVGLGLGGIGEFLLQRGSAFEVTPELRGLLEVYAEESERVGRSYARKIGLAEPKSFRAIAPNGTIAILAGTTGGIEPLFCTSYRRSFWKGDNYTNEIVIDPVAQRLLTDGRNPSSIYDAHDIDFEQRVKFQADVQEYVDMGISSTVNLPAWGTEKNNFANVMEKGDILLKYIKRLRGITVYPDGAISGQPLQKIPLDEALRMRDNVVVEGTEETCKSGVCGL